MQAEVLGQFGRPVRAENTVNLGDGDARLIADVLDRLDVELERCLRRLRIADLIGIGRTDDRRGLREFSWHWSCSLRSPAMGNRQRAIREQNSPIPH
jgi:hypothetical protein